MTDIHITNLGSAWTGGASVNAVAIGEPGVIFLAGTERKDISKPKLNPLVRAYKDGTILWEADVPDVGTSIELRSATYRDGIVYAVGGIQAGFNGQAIGLPDFQQNKPPFVQHPELDYYAFYAQFDALTGEMLFAKVFESNLSGNESLSIVRADALGNSYISGTNIAGASAVTKVSPDGEVLWSQTNGHFLLSVAEDGSVLTLLGSELLFKIDAEGNAGFNTNGWLRSLFDNPDEMLTGDNPLIQFYYHGSVIDEAGDIFLLYTQDDRSKDWRNHERGALTTLVIKISGSDGQVVWSKNIDPTGFSEASSIIFDPEGNLLVSGFTYGDFNGQAGFGGYDAYLAKLNPLDGDVLITTIIGSEGYETASQAILDTDNNLYLSGDFSSRYYSLEGSGYQNIYLISDEGFTLMGDTSSNHIQGGEGDDSISAGSGDDTLVGGSGNDTVAAGVGSDLIVGGDGAGDDVYDGGQGIDTVRYTSATAGITINFSAARDQARSISADLAGIGVDQLSNIENIIAGYYDDILTGNAADNVFAGMTGSDVIDGGAGVDVVEIASLFADVSGVALAAGGLGVVVTSAEGRDATLNVERIKFLDAEYTPEQLFDLKPLSFEFSMVKDGVSSGLRPTFFTGPASLNLHYQIIDKTLGAIIAGSTLNDFIALQGGGNKAVNGGLGNDVIDGGTGSTFVSGGGGSNTFFLDGRASGVSWSTITDFQLGGGDKATIWGWKQGVSRVKEVVENGGATGYTGLTLHFENLLPDGSASTTRNSSLNSITFSNKSLSDFGATSLDQLNQQITDGLNSHFIVGQTNDVYGEHGYLFIS